MPDYISEQKKGCVAMFDYIYNPIEKLYVSIREIPYLFCVCVWGLRTS